ncbi:polysaccharide biosynthesis tyrosine autokinase [Microbacterium profundi]|uniref:polysaccharide biosynthesis tyrosine autokinase n=1 Tax=Microbacterium profundi TaxID=450380 RepID=UPI0027E20907|nr:polysaccharide biosynthesis tyrosine autokinase [Microbacterium profundi]MCE7481999.1 polysaccharide biosynthesis tyrosine autokinase [Microbacterium profundi]
MTFRQILSALRQRWWLIAMVTILTVLGALFFLIRTTPTFSSTTELRTSAAAASGELQSAFGAIAVDLEPESLTSPDVLKAAAAITDEAPTAMYGNVTWQTVEGARRNTLVITATATDPGLAQKRASAVAEAYTAYVTAQIDEGTAKLNDQIAEATQEATTLQVQANADPTDAIAAASLARALQSVGTMSTQLDLITLSGPALTLQTVATPSERDGSSPLIIVAVAFLSGLIAGTGIALIWTQFDTRVRTPRDLESVSGAPFIAELAWERKIKGDSDRLPALARSRTALNEGLRGLRASLQVLDPQRGATFVFTSVEPDDGKTFVAANMAAIWARSGKSTILVGGDLRRPSLDGYFGDAADGAGLAELLTRSRAEDDVLGTDEILDSLHNTDVVGLSILPSGAEPSDPADLLATDGLERIITTLRGAADVVVIDSPPSYGLVDATLLAKHASGVVVLARFGRTKRELLTETVDALLNRGVHVLGLVGNRSKRRVPSSYAGYYTRSTPVAGAESPSGESEQSRR